MSTEQPPKRRKVKPVEQLNPEQERVLVDVVEHRKCVFVTGAAGTGKSYVIEKLKQTLLNRGCRVEVVAPTGLAALNVGGVTAMSFAKTWPKGLAQTPRSNPDAWLDLDVLIIDEVSMMSPDLFQYMNRQAQITRKNSKPMGGVCLVLVGDFYQLPPIKESFVFLMPLWKLLVQDNVVELTRVYRQSQGEFVSLLKRVRKGQQTPEDVKRLQTTATLETKDSAIQPTKLYCRNHDVSHENDRRLAELPGPDVKYVAHVTFPKRPKKFDEKKNMEKLWKQMPVKPEMSFRKGAQVMLCRNIAGTDLVNGSRGVIAEFAEENGFPVVQFVDCKVMMRPQHWKVELSSAVHAQVTMIPLVLAYATTIHKAQGMSIDSLEVNLDGSWEYGQAYTALSRARNFDRLRVLGFSNKSVKVSDEVLAAFG